MRSEVALLNFKTPNLNFLDPGIKERLGYNVVMGLCSVVVGVVVKKELD